MIQGISHITFVVKDLERTANLFKYIFEAEEIYSSEENTFSISKEKYFLINGNWIVIMEGESLKECTYNHVAFKINDDEFSKYERKIVELGLETRESRSRITGEGRSIYFYDYDKHLFELQTGTLLQRLNSYKAFKK